jgi:hypothetical protein
MKTTCRLIFILAVFLCVMPRQGFAQLISADKISYSLFINDRFDFMNDFYDSGRRNFKEDLNLQVLYVAPAVTIPIGPYLQAVAEVDGQFIYESGDSRIDRDIDLLNGYLKAVIPGAQWMSVAAGQQSLSTAGGFIYDDESPTVRYRADLERGLDLPLKFDTLISRIKQSSPYVHAELKYCFSLLESGSFIYGYYRDRSNSIAHIYNAIEYDNLYKSRSQTQWFGLSLRKFLGNVLMRGTALYENGTAHLLPKKLIAEERHLRTRGYLLDLNFDYSLTDRCTLTAFFFMASGDSNPQRGGLTTFLAINPFIDKTNIFFNGGIDSQFSSDNVGIGGKQLAGVITPGLNLDVRLNHRIEIKFTGAYLFTQRAPAGQGRVYGWETDCTAYYNLYDTVQFFAEANFFNPGSYFRHQTGRQTNQSTEFLFGVSYLFGN